MRKSGIREWISKENRDKGFLFAAALFVFTRIISYSLYSDSRIAAFFKPIYILCYFLVAIKVILEILQKEYRWKELLLIGGLSVFLFFNMQLYLILYRNVTIWPRVHSLSIPNVPSLKPFVTPVWDPQRIAL